jgi:hypothetical protein
MKLVYIAPVLAFVAAPLVAKAELERRPEIRSPIVDNLPEPVDALVKPGVRWQAKSLIVGQTSTATTAFGGDPIYLPSRPQKDGVVGLLMEYADGSAFVCSGSLASDRRSIITAAHCVSSGAGTANPDRTTAIFYNGPDINQVWFEPTAIGIEVSDYFVHSDYTGDVIDQNDIAVLRLSSAAPGFATAYDLYTSDIDGQFFNVAGYGARSDVGGAIGANLGTGRLREGDNIFDYRLGDPIFGTQWADDIWGVPFEQLEYSYISDFDRSGFAENDAANLAANFLGVPLDTFAQTGVGDREVGIAGGDSGGPGFIDGQLASINSWGGTFGSPEFGDVDTFLNSSWGEFSGYVPVFIHVDWIGSVLFAGGIPEPATWAMLISGFGLAGFALRRRRQLGSVSA